MSYQAYKMNSDEDLNKLRREIQTLKRQREKKVALATSKSERDKLLKEIKDLETMNKSPSKLKSFGSTFSRGFKKVGKALVKGVKTGSKNLNQNAPEYKELSRGMMKQPSQNVSIPTKTRRFPEQPRFNSWDLP